MTAFHTAVQIAKLTPHKFMRKDIVDFHLAMYSTLKLSNLL